MPSREVKEVVCFQGKDYRRSLVLFRAERTASLKIPFRGLCQFGCRGEPPRDAAGSYNSCPWETEFFALTDAAGQPALQFPAVLTLKIVFTLSLTCG